MVQQAVENQGTGKILITGGAGFLGSNLALRLFGKRDVVLLDNLTRNSLPHMANSDLNEVELIRADIDDRDSLQRALEGVDTVVHMAAIAGVHNYYEKPLEVMRVNIGGTLTLLEALKHRAIRRLIFLSTSEVYGQDAKDASETDVLPVSDPGEMRWTYAISKIAGEKACLAFGRQTGTSVVILRPFNVFGPGQTGEGAVRDMAKAAIAGKPMIVHGDGKQVRAWCHVDDFVEAAVLAISREGMDAEIFNVGNPNNAVTVAELAQSILRAAGKEDNLVFEPHFGTDIAYRTPNIESARSRLGFSPKISLEEGLKTTVEWYRNHDV